MAASFPGAVKTFSAVVNGVTKLVAALFNSPNDEITAIETALGVNLANVTLKVKVGTTTHDVSSEGDQAISGVGFTPKTVIVLVGIAGQAVSVGVDDSSAFGSVNTASGAYGVRTDYSGVLQLSGGDAQVKVTALGADGFTLTWSKSNSPTGTATVVYLAIGQ